MALEEQIDLANLDHSARDLKIKIHCRQALQSSTKHFVVPARKLE